MTGMNSFFDAWLDKPLKDRRGAAHEKESLAYIDRFDRQDVDRVSKEMRDFRVAHDKLCEVVPTGSHLFRDATHSFYKDNDTLRPEDGMDAHYLLNHRVMEEMQRLPERERLRMWTTGDIVGAALAAIDIEPDLETFYDRAKTEASDVERLADQLSVLMTQIMMDEQEVQDLQDLLDSLTPPEPLDMTGMTPPDVLPPEAPGSSQEGTEDEEPGCDDGEDGELAGAPGEGEGEGEGEDGEGEAAGQGEGDGPGTGKETGQETPAASDQPGQGDQPGPDPNDVQEQLGQAQAKRDKRVEKARQVAKDLMKAVEQATRRAMPILRQGLSQAADKAEESAMAARAWGVEPGQLQKMNAAERLQLAERIRRVRNFEAMTDMIGKLDRLATAEQMKVTYHSFEEIYDINVGNDLGRVLPSEMVALTNPTMKLDFYRKFNDRQLLEYEKRGMEKVGKGGIIFCMDNSGSMAGQPEVLAKATGIATLHIAKEQKRSFYGIHFSSYSEIECFDFRDPADQDVYRVLDFAEHFFGGGTDFRPPLVKSLEILHEENEKNGLTRSDIIFVTDGMAPLDEQFLKHFADELVRLEATCYGVAIGCPATSKPLADFCNGGVVEIKDLLSGEDLRSIFTGIGSV